MVAELVRQGKERGPARPGRAYVCSAYHGVAVSGSEKSREGLALGVLYTGIGFRAHVAERKRLEWIGSLYLPRCYRHATDEGLRSICLVHGSRGSCHKKIKRRCNHSRNSLLTVALPRST